MPTLDLNFEISSWAEILSPEYDYIFIKGGRDSGKSHEVANYLVETSCASQDDKVVCLREFQKSIAKSSKSVIEGKIKSSGAADLFEIIKTEIRCNYGDGEFHFQGMNDHTADSVKSLEGFKRGWFEEAQNASARSLKLLIPTIRMEGSQLIFSWNPEFPDDPIEKLCKENEGNDRALIIHVNYDQNAFLTEKSKRTIANFKKDRPDDFDHVYLGGYNIKSELRVFTNWIVEECAPTYGDDLFYGADWGFSQDPNVLLRCWVNEKERKIYIDQQIDGVGISIDHTPAFFDGVPDSRKYTIRADSARPEMIDYMRNRGFNCVGVEKGAGSVEQGVEFLKSYQLVVHPRCELLQKELRLYSYKTNRIGDILPKLEDKNNHCVDALRYAIEPLTKEKKQGFISI